MLDSRAVAKLSATSCCLPVRITSSSFTGSPSSFAFLGDLSQARLDRRDKLSGNRLVESRVVNDGVGNDLVNSLVSVTVVNWPSLIRPGIASASGLATTASIFLSACNVPMYGKPNVPTASMPMPLMAFSVKAPPLGHCSATTPSMVGQKNVLPSA